MGVNDTHCKACGEECGDKKSLHNHVRKNHEMYRAEYYTTYYPRTYVVSGRPVGFKSSIEAYFNEEFTSRDEMKVWIKNGDEEQVKEWMLRKLKERIETKESPYAPCEVELETLMMPSISDYEEYFGSYTDLCKSFGAELLLSITKEIPKMKKGDPTICIDTREQKPLSFPNSKVSALSYADYTLMGDDYNYTYVDRKDATDYRGTFGKQFKRFERELKRAIEMDSFIYVVIEDTLETLRNSKGFKNQVQGSEYAFKNMRKILHEYPRNIQFVFTGNRLASQNLIPFILRHGEELWDYDVYYVLRKKGII